MYIFSCVFPEPNENNQLLPKTQKTNQKKKTTTYVEDCSVSSLMLWQLEGGVA
jgi:hypothetical protein